VENILSIVLQGKKALKEAIFKSNFIFPFLKAYSQDSLAYYLEMAGKNNPAVLQKFIEYEAALQKVPQVGSLPDPELSTGVFLSPMELVSGRQVADIRLMQMFPWFGVLKNAKDEMSLMAKAKFETFRDAKLQLYFEVQRTCYELIKIRQKIRVSEKNMALLRTIERLSIVRFKAVSLGSTAVPPGVGTAQPPANGSSAMKRMGGGGQEAAIQSAAPMPALSMGSAYSGQGLTDVYRIQIEIGDLQNSIDQLESQMTTTMVQFNNYLNRPKTMPAALPDTLTVVAFQPSLLAISDTILNNNPMLEMLQFENQSLEARRRMISKMSYPMVGLGLNYSLINKSEMSVLPMNGKDMMMPMVTVTLPVYRKKYRKMIEETELLKSANTQNFRASALSLQTEYSQALQFFQDAQRRLKLYQDQYRLASKSLDITVQSFAASGAGLTDVLRFRQQTLDYEYRQSEAAADQNIAIAWLQKLSCVEVK